MSVPEAPPGAPWRGAPVFAGSVGLDWCEELLDLFDLGKLSRLTVRDGSGRAAAPPGVWGTCYYPRRGLETYRITCSIKGPFPASVHTRKSPLYAGADGAYPPAPHGVVLGQEFFSRRGAEVRRWIRVYGETVLDNVDEALVWIVAHESFHYLRRTRQVPGRNMEIDADAFSDEALEHFREGWSPSRFAALQDLRAEKAKGRVETPTGRRGA